MNKDAFQGKYNKKNYFEGWYIKFVSQNGFAFALIPGVSIKNNKKEFFLQYIDKQGISKYFRYKEKDINFNKDYFQVTIGDSFFSYEKATINIKEFDLKGEFYFKNLINLRSSIYMPTIMGPFSYIPFMQCNHGLLSLSHSIWGYLEKNGIRYNFDNGKGYIEKDWGSSFPEEYIWLQSNNFEDIETSFMFSLATIPFCSLEFNGFFGFIYFNRAYYVFATYTGAKIKKVEVEGDRVKIVVLDRKYRLEVEGVSINKAPLSSPRKGEMTGTIHESIDGLIYIKIYDKRSNNLIYQDKGKNSGVEIVNCKRLLKK